MIVKALILLIGFAVHESYCGMEMFFPEAWDGDKFQKQKCVSSNVPQWLDGYFLMQTAASYGKQADPVGEKLIHYFDGFGAVSSFEFTNGGVQFSARYYPSRIYKIWEFYNRDLKQSKVAFIPQFSPYNLTAKKMWDNIPLYNKPVDPAFQNHPNIDFWRIGHEIIAATEITDIGMAFNVSDLKDFRHPHLIETNDIFRKKGTIIPITMAVHERKNQDDIIYAVCSAFDPVNNKMYQIVFKVTPDGTRTVEGMFEMGTYDPKKCTQDGKYTGDKKILANYMHSISSTQRYVILPLTSMVINPCKIGPLGMNLTLDQLPDLPSDIRKNFDVVEYNEDVPLKFLVFDKMNKKFVTEKPIEIDAPMTPVHQFNAYEDNDGTLVVDMATADGLNGQVYNSLHLEKILHSDKTMFHLLRFRINLQTNTITHKNILDGQDYYHGEFPNFNQKFIERRYKFGYIMTGFLTPGAKISKVDMDAGKIVGEFSAPNGRQAGTVFREPWFVPRPGSTEEDDGIVLVLGGDINTETSTLYLIDAKTMSYSGSAEIPIVVPLGLHNRFFFRTELGMAPSIPMSNVVLQSPVVGNGPPQSVVHTNGQLSPFEQAFYRQRYDQSSR